MHRINVNQNK